jgi:hypothetical protein
MDPLSRFLDYFQAFERTYLDDDWGRLEEFFAPDAVYRIRGSGDFDCDIHGRDAIFAAIRRFVDGFDRRCIRELRPVGTIRVEGDTVSGRGIAAYRRGESPELVLDIEESAEFRDGVIVTLTDTYAEKVDDMMRRWMERWGPDLVAAYQ